MNYNVLPVIKLTISPTAVTVTTAVALYHI